MLGSTLGLALREIRRNGLRSGLTALGIVIGVGAVVAMVGLGDAAQARVTREISGMGRNLLIAVPGSDRRGAGVASAPAFEAEDARAIGEELPRVADVAPAASRGVVARFGGREWPTTVTGTDNGWFATRDWRVAEGRRFDPGELRGGRAVCLLGATVRRELFGLQDPVGASVRVGKIACDVIGVLESKGPSAFGNDQDDFVLVPLTTFQRRITGDRKVTMIMISARDAASTLDVKRNVQQLLRQRRGIAPEDADDFFVRDMQEIVRIMENVTGILTRLLGAIAAISLLVGGIGIMNIMLVSVVERTREIGIRLAIGALEREVLLQFLVESVMLSVIGGVAGVTLGLAVSAVGARVLGVPFAPSLAMVAIALLFSGGVGVVFGYFPARRAARLDPIDALRHE